MGLLNHCTLILIYFLLQKLSLAPLQWISPCLTTEHPCKMAGLDKSPCSLIWRGWKLMNLQSKCCCFFFFKQYFQRRADDTLSANEDQGDQAEMCQRHNFNCHLYAERFVCAKESAGVVNKLISAVDFTLKTYMDSRFTGRIQAILLCLLYMISGHTQVLLKQIGKQQLK